MDYFTIALLSNFVKRNGLGHQGRQIKVRTNYFEIKSLPNSDIHHYNIIMMPEVPPALNRKIFKQQNFLERHFGGRPVYDGRRNIYTHRQLPFGDATVFKVLMASNVLIHHKPLMLYNRIGDSIYVNQGSQPLYGPNILNYQQNMYMQQFGLQVSDAMIEVSARVLPVPPARLISFQRMDSTHLYYNLQDEIKMSLRQSWVKAGNLARSQPDIRGKYMFAAKKQYCANVCLKINVKLGDSKASRYAASIRFQISRQEVIADLAGMVKKQLKTFYQTFGRKSELACKSLDEQFMPRLTFVVVHPVGNKDSDRTSNCLPGTVITHPFEFNFYLQSHPGLQGTSRPAHYHVSFDENGFNTNSLQTLSYNLCYNFARCTRAYYARLVCKRARTKCSEEVPPALNIKIFQTAVELFRTSDFSGIRPVYDGRRNIYTANPLPFGNIDVTIPEDDGVLADSRLLYGGIEVWRGYFQSIRPTPGKIMINIDLHTTAFYESASQTKFEIDDKQKNAATYYQETYNKRLQYPFFPCVVQWKNKCYLRKLNDKQIANSLKFNCQPPNIRANKITQGPIILNYQQNEYLVYSERDNPQQDVQKFLRELIIMSRCHYMPKLNVCGVATQYILGKHMFAAKKQYCANICLKINVKSGGASVTHPAPGEMVKEQLKSFI
ncbi:hypothetical protein C1645_874012 [Glomus cerebriforme]|uniref:Piwi domain-containing protein n=1 Tax=Glomus cerebriforme TaxID=658196 RepID=A0A397TF17_9GLOM|nr:hypothetical protein C1645_874012 [Glomus cerebriforme]